MEDSEDEAAWTVYDASVQWWSDRTWDAGHLVYPPRIWLWRNGEIIHIRWDNRDAMVGNIPVWKATFGEIILPVSQFMAEVESFHDRFLLEIGNRADAMVADWSRPEVKIDIPHLLKEQRERQDWLGYALAPRPLERLQAFSWDEVRIAITTITNEVSLSH